MILGVTGGLGFLGHHFVTRALHAGHRCWVIDAETYAADRRHLEEWSARDCQYGCADIVTLDRLPDVEVLINFAAETHVDNSIRDSRAFLHSNVLGVQHLLTLIQETPAYARPRFLQISTDEVYGTVLEGSVAEDAPLRPSSPYAASKAAADLLLHAAAVTYGIRYNILRPSNCYGTGQHPEKLIPKAIRYARTGQPFPRYGDGGAERSWLDVDDCAEAVLRVLSYGREHTVYNIAGNTAANTIAILNAIDPHGPVVAADRSGLDRRYSVADAPLRALGWTPQGDLWRDLPGILEAERATGRW